MSFAVETQLEAMCYRLGLDPVEVRLKNLRKKGDVLPNGDVLRSYGLPQCIKEAALRIGWWDKKDRKGFRGVGMGVSSMFSGAHNFPFSSAAMVRLNHDGRVILYTGQTEFGIGVSTVMAQIVAEVLGCPLDFVVVNLGDSEVSPHDIGNWLSAGIFTSGEAVRRAALDLRDQILSYASEALGVPKEDLYTEGGWVRSVSDPGVRLHFSDISKYGIQLAGGDSLVGKGYAKCVPEAYFWRGRFSKTPSLSKGGGRFTEAYGFAASTAEVEVDPETGEVSIKKIVVADDCGTPINVSSVEGQILSQAVMAIGDVLFEEVRLEGGVVENPDFLNYRLPSVFDVPEIETVIVDSYEPKGPFGAKEVGETCRAAVIAAISSAIGKRIYFLPLTPDKIKRALMGT